MKKLLLNVIDEVYVSCVITCIILYLYDMYVYLIIFMCIGFSV